MNVDSKKLIKRLFYLLIAFEIVFCVLIFNSNYEDMRFNNQPVYELNNNWVYIDVNGKDKSTNLPAKLEVSEDKKLVLRYVLPDDLTTISTLCIRTSQQSIKAYIDTELIYAFGDDPGKKAFGKSSGSAWNIIRLPIGAENKTITLEITYAYNINAGVVNKVYGGTKSSVLFNLAKIYGLGFILSIFILLIGICLIFVSLIFKKLLSENKAILYLGWFSILVSLWMLGESKLLQLFIGNQLFVFSMTIISLMLFPISLLLYISTIENYRFKKLLSHLIYLLCCNAYIMILLQLLNFLDFYQAVLPLHALTVFSCVVTLITLFVDLFKYKNKQIKSVVTSLCILWGFFIIEIIYFHTNKSVSTVNFVQLGVLFFITKLSWEAIQKSIHILTLSKNAKYYELLATRDSMTNCKNRAAYITDLAAITADQSVGIVLIDINNLKYINDTYGHHMGDNAIIDCSKCLKEVFKNENHCYRIGGDEFVYIEHYSNKEILEENIEKFIQECEKENANTIYDFKIAIGYAIYDKTTDTEISDTVRRADKNMYEVKAMMKVTESTEATNNFMTSPLTP